MIRGWINARLLTDALSPLDLRKIDDGRNEAQHCGIIASRISSEAEAEAESFQQQHVSRPKLRRLLASHCTEPILPRCRRASRRGTKRFLFVQVSS